MSIGVIGGDCIARSFSACGQGCASVGERENTGGDLVTSHLTGADGLIGVIILVVPDAVVRLTAGIGVRRLEGVDQKLRQSS